MPHISPALQHNSDLPRPLQIQLFSTADGRFVPHAHWGTAMAAIHTSLIARRIFF